MAGNIALWNGIPVELQKKKGLRNMYLRIRRDGTVLVTAPYRTADRTVEAFLRSREDWIQKTIRKVEQHYQPDPPGFLRLWGSLVPYYVQQDKRGKVVFGNNEVTIYCPDPEDSSKIQTLLKSGCSKALKAVLPDLLKEWEQLTGKKAGSITIRDMVSRWGSCNPKTASITLNLRLIRHDPACLRYVLIHELVHLYEPSHNQRFQDLMTRFCPEWKQLRRQLKSEPF
jgi:predicted metal-dependent hydrolase